MDPKHKMLLQQHQKDIVRDLDVAYIIDELYTCEALSQDDFDHIVNLTSRVDRTRFLIDGLIQKGSNYAYKVFVDSLQKDHVWLWEKFSADNLDSSAFHDTLEDNLSRGDVPRLPDHYVQRTHEEQEVASKLKLLTRHKLLALHGMSGCGKSSVVVGVLRNNPELITANFGGVVFWLNLGNCKTEDDIVAVQSKLHRKASTMYMHRNDSTFMNSSISMSSIGSNADSHSLASYDWSWKDLRDMLKTLFSEPALKEALLVLDEVNEKKCVEAFDVGCKLLVTTRDTEVVASFQPQIVKIKNSLDEIESLRLFAACLEVDVSQLPRQAKKLNEICQGSPFHVALIGAQLAENKERLIDDTRHWNYYISMLRKKEYFFITRSTDNPIKTVEMCINSLKPDILPLFKMLAVLPDNVKVSSRVLTKLWNKPIRDVEDIMSQLKCKSLIIQCYNQEQRNYNYEVHDLIMNYLRNCSTEDEIEKMHLDFLKSYHYENQNNCPVDIADDGYISFYIGHHIFHTKNMDGKWALFQLFLNLKFLGNKVRLTGPADAIMDFQKYESLIAQTELDRELVFHIKGFLRTHGNDLYRFPRTDIVQSILQYESKGILYTRAYEIAQDSCAKNELYFDLLHEQNVEEITHSTIDVKESITSVCFLGDYVLVGTTNGAIKVFHVFTNKLKKELPSAGAPIKWVATCPANPLVVAALTGEGVLQIWFMDEMELELSENAIEEEPEEISYNDTYRSPVTISPKLGPFMNCQWTNNEEALITHTSKMIILYGADGKVIKVLDNFERDKIVVCCVPSNDDRHVLAATCVGSAYYIEVLDLRTKERIMCIEETIPVLNILTVPGNNRMLILNEKEVLEHEFKIHSYSQNNFNTYSCKNIISSSDVKEGVSFVTAVVNKSGSLLFISTDDSRIICIDLKTNLYVFDLDNRRGNVVCMAVSEVWYDEFVPGSDVLVSGSGASEHSAKVWRLDAGYVSQTTQKHRKVRLTTKFDVSFLQSTSPHTPSGHVTPPTDHQGSTPKRHQSFITYKEVEKKPAKKTMSLDRHSLKPLNLKGICNGNDDGGLHPLLAVVDDRNNIQIIRGRKVLTEIPSKSDDKITVIKISPCNQYLVFGLQSGNVKKYTLRSKETKAIMDVYSPVLYLKFINPGLLIVAGKNKSLMAYRLHTNCNWKLEMLQKGNMHLGSQEILNDLQGMNKKKNGAPESLSQSGSETSIASKERQFPTGDAKNRLYKGSYLVDCFWVDGVGMITVENNATIKLWSPEMKLIGVLNGRQTDVYVNCAAYQNNVLVVCDDYGKFQAFSLKEHNETHEMYLQTIQENKVNYKILSCDLTTDGHILAMGLDSGDVVIWNIPGKCQLYFLRHHKAKVQTCFFSPVPDKLYRSNSTAQSPVAGQMFNYSNSSNISSNTSSGDDEQPPLVLVTMASEIVWWNVTYLMRIRAQNRGLFRTRINVLTPLASPMENRTEITAALDNLSLDRKANFFFGEGNYSAHDCWEALWRRKTYKEGSKRKEILACIKLSGMNAKKLCHDDNFSCFVTVDNPGHIHIMNLMRPAAS